MPATLEALVIFAAAIAPGYGFLSGYQHQRSHTSPERDLHVLAQAFIISALWIAVTWWPAGHLLTQWTSEGDLSSHEFATWLLVCLLLSLPYAIGRALGLLIRVAEGGKPHWLFSLLSAAGAFEPPTLWDWTWERARERGSVVLVVRLKDGGVIEGQFAGLSRADFSPRKPALYLEKAYGYDQAGQRVQYPRGAYLEAEEIAGAQFKT
jgi:hypothetical protein